MLWWQIQDGVEFGPWDGPTLASLIQQGKVPATATVRNEHGQMMQAGAAVGAQLRLPEMKSGAPFWVVVAVGILIFVIVLVVAISSGDHSGDGEDYAESEYAEAATFSFIKQTLKSPTTAQFEASDVSLMPDDRWMVEGTVDSQNSFGAMIRQNFIAVVYRDDIGDWRLLYLKLGDDEIGTFPN